MRVSSVLEGQQQWGGVESLGQLGLYIQFEDSIGRTVRLSYKSSQECCFLCLEVARRERGHPSGGCVIYMYGCFACVYD